MEWRVIVAMLVAIPIILLPAAFVWYFNIGGLFAALKERRRQRKTIREVEEMTEGVHLDQITDLVDGVNETMAGIHAAEESLKATAGPKGLQEALRDLQTSYELMARARALESSLHELTRGMQSREQEPASAVLQRAAAARG